MALPPFLSLASPAVLSPTRTNDESALVWLLGEHDISTVKALSAIIDRAITFNSSDLILDLSEVSFMDVATVEVIVRAREYLDLRARSLVLRSPPRCARLVLELCGLTYEADPTSISRESFPTGDPNEFAAPPGQREPAPLPGPEPTETPVLVSASSLIDEVSSVGREVDEERMSYRAGYGNP